MNRPIKFRVWDEEEQHMTYQGEPCYETLQSFIANYGDKTLMQYIGASDINDMSIYEGDIIRYRHNKQKHIVVFMNNCFMAESLTDTNKLIDDILTFETEVIGNIYENRDLLEQC